MYLSLGVGGLADYRRYVVTPGFGGFSVRDSRLSRNLHGISNHVFVAENVISPQSPHSYITSLFFKALCVVGLGWHELVARYA